MYVIILSSIACTRADQHINAFVELIVLAIDQNWNMQMGTCFPKRDENSTDNDDGWNMKWTVVTWIYYIPNPDLGYVGINYIFG